MPKPLTVGLSASTAVGLAFVMTFAGVLAPTRALAADSGPAGPGLAAWFGLLVLSLLVVLVAALLWVARQRVQGQGTAGGIAILGTRALGPREQLVVVRIEDRILVLGHTSAHINLVTELDSYTAETGSASKLAPGFQQQLQRWLRREQA